MLDLSTNQHPTWLTNVVLVKKKNGQIRYCVDFRDLDKVCLKDLILLPNIDLLIDATSGHSMFSFMFHASDRVRWPEGEQQIINN